MAKLAATQHGIVSREQLLDVGISADTIDKRLRRGRLHRLHRGLYAVGHTAVSDHGRLFAAVMACGASAVLSHRSAASVWGLLMPEPKGPIHVTVTSGHRRRRQGIHVHHSRAPGVVRHGLSVTPPLRTLVDLADVRDRHLDRAVEQALILRLVEPEQLVTTNSPALCALVSGDPQVTRSEAERRFLALIRRAGLPTPTTNARVTGHEVDAVWPLQNVIAEMDGFAYHSTRRAFERDRLRDQQLTAAGFRVLRVTWRQITTSPEAVAARLAAVLAAG